MQGLKALLMIVFCLVATVAASAKPILVMEARSGKILYAEDATAPWYPASLTKMMTAYVTFRAIRDGRISLDDRIANSPRAASMPASKVGLPLDATLPLENALRILIVKSANDVAVMIAEHVAGSVEAFASEMNRTAEALGMYGTHFVNPNGLPNLDQYTTARDMAKLARAIMHEFPQYNDMFGMDRVKLGRRSLRSHNSLLRSFEGADGMKTGFICASGYNIVASATRNGRRLIAVVLGAKSGRVREDIATKYLKLGFQNAWTNPLVVNLRPASMQQASVDGTVTANALISSRRPTHMGPVVCRRRYPASRDPHDIDRWAQKMANLAATVELPTLRPGSAPRGVAVTETGYVPLPVIRPAS